MLCILFLCNSVCLHNDSKTALTPENIKQFNNYKLLQSDFAVCRKMLNLLKLFLPIFK